MRGEAGFCGAFHSCFGYVGCYAVSITECDCVNILDSKLLKVGSA